MVGSNDARGEQRIQAVLQESTCTVVREFETLEELFHRSDWIPSSI